MESIAAGPERSRATVTTVVRKMGERLMVDVGPEIEGQYVTMKELAMILPVLLLALQAHERMLQQAVASRDLLLMQERTLKSLLELCCEDEQRIEQEERLCEEEQKRLQEEEKRLREGWESLSARAPQPSDQPELEPATVPLADMDPLRAVVLQEARPMAAAMFEALVRTPLLLVLVLSY